MKAIIIDDEKRARETIKDILKLYCPKVEIIAEAEGINDALVKIGELNPELLFLDIKLADGNAFDLLKKIDTIKIKIIFITAYDEYAIKAFKFSAIDYLLKPIDPHELIKAVENAETIIEKEILQLKLHTFLDNLQNINNEIKKIVVKTNDNIFVLTMKDIIRCEADGNYTRFFLSTGKTILVSNTLKEYDEMLQKYNFFRTHQSHLVNLNYIEAYEKKDGGSIIMKDKSRVPVAVRKKEMLLSLLESI